MGTAPDPKSSYKPVFHTPERQINQYHQLLNWYGIRTELNNSGTEFLGDCPFWCCLEDDKHGKFSMNIQTGQWRCFYGGGQGNTFDLIRNLHSQYFDRTTDDQYVKLKALRRGSVDIKVLKEMQVAWNPATNEWLLPSWGTDGAVKGIINLYVYRKSFDVDSGKQSMQVLSGPTFKHVPYGIHRLRSGIQRPIWVLEGHFDYLAANSLLRSTEPRQSENVDTLGAPGAGTFPRQFLNVFSGRDVVLMFDHDKAGQEGMESITKAMAANGVFPSSLRHITWPTDSSIGPGYDVTDVVVGLPRHLISRKKS